MSIGWVILLATSLCFDTLAVSAAGGACLRRRTPGRLARIILSFALFQGGFTFLGWALGSTFSHYVIRFDHWIAFVLLSYIGLRMILESRGKEAEGRSVDLFTPFRLMLASAATSIDALAVGISFALLGLPLREVLLDALVIALVTALAAALGLLGGSRFGPALGNRSALAGGVVLVVIGLKILVEHLFF